MSFKIGDVVITKPEVIEKDDSFANDLIFDSINLGLPEAHEFHDCFWGTPQLCTVINIDESINTYYICNPNNPPKNCVDKREIRQGFKEKELQLIYRKKEVNNGRD